MLADMAPVEKQQSIGLQDTEDDLASKLTALDLVNMSSFKLNCSDYCNKIKTLKPMIRSNNQSGLQLSQHHARSKHRRSPVNDRTLNLISRFVFIETYMISWKQPLPYATATIFLDLFHVFIFRERAFQIGTQRHWFQLLILICFILFEVPVSNLL